MIYYFYENKFRLYHQYIYTIWIKIIIKNEKYILKNINYIFCNDDYLFKINKKYLYHNNYTDIITFNNSKNLNSHILYGDIFLSTERIKDNAINFKQNFNIEIKRVMIHGILHLIGYNDICNNTMIIMKKKENFYINLWKQLFYNL